MLLELILKPVLSFAFGTPKSSKISMAVIFILALALSVWWVTDTYGEMELANQELKSHNEAFDIANKALLKNSLEILKQKEDQAISYDAAILAQQALSEAIVKISQEKENDLKVFKRKSKSYQDMLNHRGQKIVDRANAASKRVRDKWAREAASFNNKIREGESDLPKPSNTERSDSE